MSANHSQDILIITHIIIPQKTGNRKKFHAKTAEIGDYIRSLPLRLETEMT